MTINSAMLSRDLGRVRELRALNHLDVAQRLERCERERTLLVAALSKMLANGPGADHGLGAELSARDLLRELGEVAS